MCASGSMSEAVSYDVRAVVIWTHQPLTSSGLNYIEPERSARLANGRRDGWRGGAVTRHMPCKTVAHTIAGGIMDRDNDRPRDRRAPDPDDVDTTTDSDDAPRD